MKSLFITLIALCNYTGIYCQQVNIIKITDLEKRINNTSDTTYIVNFWATWCVPCVKELPDFDSIHTVYTGQKVKVLLISLDFKEDLESKVLPFITSRKVKSEVLLLDELNSNYFIPKISNDWTGAIPATLIKNNKQEKDVFFEKKLNFVLLKDEIEKMIER